MKNNDNKIIHFVKLKKPMHFILKIGQLGKTLVDTVPESRKSEKP